MGEPPIGYTIFIMMKQMLILLCSRYCHLSFLLDTT